MGDFLWAVAQMKEGKKVRRKGIKQTKNYIWYIPSGTVGLTTLGKPETKLIVDDFEATDWEIVEEKKTSLSKKICRARIDVKTEEPVLVYDSVEDLCDTDEPCLHLSDVQEAIKDIKEDIDNETEPLYLTKGRVKDIINKRIGDRLIGAEGKE